MRIFDFFKHINLTADQRNALEKLESFFENDSNVFLLKGYAGTGKTTLIKGISDYLEDKKRTFNLMAPTGRAAMVISEKTREIATTIHKGIYNYDDIEDKEEENSFYINFKLHQNRFSSNHVALIDEASMIGDVFNDDEFFIFGSGHLLQDLFTYMNLSGSSRKIVFIGDDAQLPPVDMNFSPALHGEYLEKTYQLKVEEYTLSEVVRQQENSGVLQIATNIRNQINKGVFNSLSFDENGKDIRAVSIESFKESFTQTASKENLKNIVLVTHSNKQALSYNKIIRDIRYGENPTILKIKDRLVVTRNNYNTEVELFNGMFVTVKEVGEVVYKPLVAFKIKGGDTVKRQLSFREVTVEVEDLSGKIYVFKSVLLDFFLLENNGKLHPYDQRALYIDFKNRMRDKGIKPKSEQYKMMIKKDAYFNAIQAKYGYAITCHKSQGGEWSNVFVDFNAFIGKKSKAFFRWAYTAITRSNRNLFTLNAISFNALSEFEVAENIANLSNVPKESIFLPISKEEGESLYFLKYRKNKLEQLCKENNIYLGFEDYDFQLKTTFTRERENASLSLWYGNNGFSKTTWQNVSNKDFKKEINYLLKSSLRPEPELLKFEYKFEFQEEMHDYFTSILKEQEVPLMNLVQLQWSDRYFLQTEADCAFVEFFFNAKGSYTKVNLKSTLGKEDAILSNIHQILIAQKV